MQELHELNVLREDSSILELDGNLEVPLQQAVHIQRDRTSLHHLGVKHALGKEVADFVHADATAADDVCRQVNHLDAEQSTSWLLGNHIFGGFIRVSRNFADVSSDAPAVPPELFIEDHELALTGNRESLVVRDALAIVNLKCLHCALGDTCANEGYTSHQPSTTFTGLAVHVHHIFGIRVQPRLHTIRKCNHRFQRRSIVVLKRIPFNSSVKYRSIVTPSIFAAEVVHFIMIFVMFVHESFNFHSGVAIHVLQPSSGKTMNNNTRGYISHI